MSVEYVVKGYITEFCDKFGVKLEHLKGKSRVLEINNTRKLLFYMLRRVFKLKHREIGEILNRHHASCVHHVADFDQLKDMYSLYSDMYVMALEIALKHLDIIRKMKTTDVSPEKKLIETLMNSNYKLRKKISKYYAKKEREDQNSRKELQS